MVILFITFIYFYPFVYYIEIIYYLLFIFNIKIHKKLFLGSVPKNRHTFITKAKESGLNEYILKLIVGHTIKNITERVYTHRELEDLKKEIEKTQK